MSDELIPNNSQFLIYETEDGKIKIDVRFEEETVWLTQKELSVLFQTTVANINIHIKNILEEGELDGSTIKDSLIVRKEGNRQVRRNTQFYNLDMIISIGYRIKSITATRFRQWATAHLKEFIIKGFILDDERLKNPDLPFDYFEELLERIQDIRTSERRFYQKITDIYATSIDYDPTTEESILFFKTIQNENELSALNNLVEQYLVFAQGQAMRRVPMHMEDWIGKLDAFLNINDREILQDAGKISHSLAVKHVEEEYEKYRTISIKEQDKLPNDFEKVLGLLGDKSPK